MIALANQIEARLSAEPPRGDALPTNGVRPTYSKLFQTIGIQSTPCVVTFLMIPTNHPTTILFPGPPPPQLLLAQFCSVTLPAFNLAPQLLPLRVTAVTARLWHILDHESYQRRPQDDPAEKGWLHGGLNE